MTSTSTTTSAKATGPTNLATIGTYSYVGCYIESTTGHALSALIYANNNMTIEICYATCSALPGNYSWFGVEYHRECYCGNSLAAGSVPAASGCVDTCMANTNQICGGASRLSMYNN
ncbi:WSC-domain-containing protein, partial [Hyaloscypha variabilis F]